VLCSAEDTADSSAPCSGRGYTTCVRISIHIHPQPYPSPAISIPNHIHLNHIHPSPHPLPFIPGPAPPIPQDGLGHRWDAWCFAPLPALREAGAVALAAGVWWR